MPAEPRQGARKQGRERRAQKDWAKGNRIRISRLDAEDDTHDRATEKMRPKSVAIKAGDTVQWHWAEDNHSTTSDTGIWDSGVQNTGFNFPHTFSLPGTFPYHCSIHGGVGGLGMSGTVTVT